MENIHFINVPEDEKEIAEGIIKSNKEKGKEKIPGEYEKTEDDIKAISTSDNLIREEIKLLGIKPKNNPSLDMIHLIGNVVAKDVGMKMDAVFNSERSEIFINKDSSSRNRLSFYKSILHELIHYYSFASYLANGESKDIDVYRSGYLSKNPTKEHEHFRGLNEAVTEKILQDLVFKNRDELIKKFNITKEELQKESKSISGYQEEIDLLNVIIEGIAKYYSKSFQDVWDIFKKSLFSGNILHLRDVEKVFGLNSLRVLAKINPKKKFFNAQQEEDFFNKLNKFFSNETTKDARLILAKQILSEK